jgi:hypothetical protein
MKMTKEEFIEKCGNDITLMSNVSGTSTEECAESLYVTYCSFNIDEDKANDIIDKLSNLPLENPVSVKELEDGLKNAMKYVTK